MKWLVLVVVLLVPSVAQAADDSPPPIVTLPPGDDVIKPLAKGKPAPFTGHLFDTDTAMRWGFWLQQYKLRLKVDVDATQKACDIKLDHGKELRMLEANRNERIEGDLRTRLVRSEKGRIGAEYDARNPSFFRSMEFGLVLGVVVTAGGAIAIALAAK